METLKYSLIICIDFLAWPLIALAYPLFASIRAVDSGSKYHMTKLVKYWTLFALICLFEFAFAKIIHWIPWWPRIRLALLLWLVLPQFDGASYAYQLLLNIKLNGSKALENPKECNRDVKFTEAEKNAAAAAATIQVKQVNETLESPAASPLEKPPKQEWNCDLCNVKTTSENNLNAHLKGRIHKSNCPAPPLEKPPKQEWTCHLCNVRTNSENNLNAHLKGRIHKSNCASLKAIKLEAKDTGPCKDRPKKHDAARPNQIFKRHCHVCDVKPLTDMDLASHLKGKRHLSNMANLQRPC